MQGYNGTVFTYGQTGSGKTHSILGNDQDPGITIRCIGDIFKHIRANPDIEYSLKVSYMEVSLGAIVCSSPGLIHTGDPSTPTLSTTHTRPPTHAFRPSPVR